MIQTEEINFEESINVALVSNAEIYLDFMNKIKSNKGLNNLFLSQMFQWYSELLKGE